MTDTPKVLIPGEGRPEWHGRLTPERSISVVYAMIFYGFLAACAAVWIHFAGVQSLAQVFAVADPLRVAVLGIGLGLGCVLLSWVSLSIFTWAQALEEEFGWMLGEQKRHEIVILAVASGVAEELFFRGAMQPHLGLWGTAAVFGAIHFPINDRYRGWPVFAFLMGLLLGWEFATTGSVITPILTHITVNTVNLWRIVSKYAKIPPVIHPAEVIDGQQSE